MRHKKAAPAPEHYPLVIISDTHLGMSNDASDLLCEFLHNTKCDKLILNGDIVDGLRLNSRPPKEFSEAQKRVVDAINRKIAEGTEVIYIPGNHDAALRRMKLFGTTFMGIRFEKDLDFTDPKGQRFFITHGDRFDPGQTHPQKIPQGVHKLFDHGYVAIAKISAAIDRVTHKLLKHHFAVAAVSRRTIEGKILHSTQRHEKTATDYARKHGYNGIISGHFHIEAQKKTKDGIVYLNSGDWVESFTALTLNKDGEWNVVKWPKKRMSLGLKRDAAVNDNPDKAFRPATEKILAEVRRIWPGRKKGPKAPPHP